MNSYKFYYINLDKSKARREFIEGQFKKLNTPITRIPAVYGKELPKPFLEKAKSQFNILTHYPNLNDGEIGLTKTYFDLWKVIEKQKEKFAIVLEDDALITKEFIDDLPSIFNEITTNDFVDISGRKGFFKTISNNFTQLFIISPLQTTGQIIGKDAAKVLATNLTTFYAPIDVLKQDVYKHKVKTYTTNKSYVKSNDKALGGTTLQLKGMSNLKKIIRELIRPFWQIVSFFSYKLNRFVKNYIFYKKH
ncbi:glycosyltransferase family 25 protein [uncultured Polaribacter sp.]|uniref:glycosyltransferase family 25 protein n=1 Tax=uncultured Polaribacter sp. TaxID=174711 RepID=UPI00259BE711|nr:glycosyltransferase family 25 protein [uncultured Polaribacter sp.]